MEDGTSTTPRHNEGTRTTGAVACLPAVSTQACELRDLLDRLADSGWPALEREPLGEWMLRAADGVTNRANSVLTSGPMPSLGPAVDAAGYSGPDTNSTAFAAMALHAEGATAAATAATSWLAGTRSADGGFPFFGDPTQPSDGNSTGVVLLALTTVSGTVDDQAVAALAALQSPCGADPADVGGIAFQPSGGVIAPDQMATIQALLGLDGLAFPFVTLDRWHDASATCSVDVPTTTATPTTVAAAPVTTTGAVPDPTAPAATAPTGTDELARTGGGIGGLGDGGLAALGVLLLASGAVVASAERRRRHIGA